MKRISIAFGVILMFFSCGNEPKDVSSEEKAITQSMRTGDYISHTDHEYGFTIDYPANWDTTNTEPNLAFLARELAADTADKFTENFTVFVMAAEGQTLDALAEANIKMASEYYGLTDVKSTKAVNKNGVEYIRVSLPIEAQGMQLIHSTTFFAKDDKVFTLSQMTEAGKAEKYEPVFRHVVDSFR